MAQTMLAVQDPDIVAAIRRGEAAAEAALYEKYAARVYYLSLRELRSSHDAEDVRAETFLRVLQAIRSDRFRHPGALGAFVLGAAYNVIRECRRKRSRAGDPLTEDEAAGPRALEPAAVDPIAARTIEQVARRLKPRERAFLRMYYYEELASEEIARRLGIRAERVRLIKSRTLKSFREIYARLAGGRR